MSDAKPTVTLNWGAAKTHLDAIKNKIMEYQGKAGFNPFMWWAKHGAELEKNIGVESSKTSALYDKVMALKFEEPKIDPKLGVAVKKAQPKLNFQPQASDLYKR